MSTSFDIVISGAGPAGTSAAAFLGKAGIPHLLIDKAVFPRDKICGDALSGKVLPLLRKLHPQLLENLISDTDHFMESHGIRFASPDGNFIDIPFRKDVVPGAFPPGFISKRIHFDHFLQQTINHDYTEFRQGHELKSLSRTGAGIQLDIAGPGSEYSITTKLLIAADGERSLAARILAGMKLEREHFCGGIRAYYSGVKGLHDRNFIELHFLKGMLPGYLWIFPLPNGMANVGAGLLSSVIQSKKINLRELMLKALREEPTIRDRFTEAKLEGKIEGWGLPLGSKRRTISGDHFLLTGDAASMIDPFTGEGISNAMFCGMVAAETAAKAVRSGTFNRAFLATYDEQVYRRLWSELKISRNLQQLCKYPWLFNFVVRKAARNKTFRDTITCMFDDIDMRGKLTSPGFYFRMLFDKSKN
jgi:geranylgeranyl reductase family protein